MKKTMLCLLLLGSAWFSAAGQNDCGTKTPRTALRIPREVMRQKLEEANRSLIGNYLIKLHVTVFANGNGTNRAATNTEIAAAVDEARTVFNQRGICIFLTGIEQVDNTDLNVGFDENELALVPYMKPNCFNLFIHTSFESDLCGTSYEVLNTGGYFSVRGSCMTSKRTLVHEFGHVLGLYHTFETAYGAESVQRPGEPGNCLDCGDDGDLCCDTPADPDPDEAGFSWNSTTCTYTGTVTDECGKKYSPDENNMMSYYGKCRNHFSQDQGVRMRYFIDDEQDFQNKLAQSDVIAPLPAPGVSESFSANINGNVATHSLTICYFSSNSYTVNGSATHRLQAPAVMLGPGTLLAPSSTGSTLVTTEGQCQ